MTGESLVPRTAYEDAGMQFESSGRVKDKDVPPGISVDEQMRLNDKPRQKDKPRKR